MAKKIMQKSKSIAASTTEENVLSGTRYERSPFELALMSVYATGSAAGLTCEINVGGESVSDPVTVNAQNRLPVEPDDLLVDQVTVKAGQLIQLRVVNTTAGALSFNYKVSIQEMEYQEG